MPTGAFACSYCTFVVAFGGCCIVSYQHLGRYIITLVLTSTLLRFAAVTLRCFVMAVGSYVPAGFWQGVMKV